MRPFSLLLSSTVARYSRTHHHDVTRDTTTVERRCGFECTIERDGDLVIGGKPFRATVNVSLSPGPRRVLAVPIDVIEIGGSVHRISSVLGAAVHLPATIGEFGMDECLAVDVSVEPDAFSEACALAPSNSGLSLQIVGDVRVTGYEDLSWSYDETTSNMLYVLGLAWWSVTRRAS